MEGRPMIRIMVDGLPVYVVDVLSAAILARHLKDAGPDDEPRNEKGEWTSGGGGAGSAGGGGEGGPSAAVKQYGSQLLGALGKEGFADVYARLKSDKSIGRPEMATIAHQFNGPVAPSASRPKDP